MKKIALLHFLLLTTIVFCQDRKISLDEAIQLAQKKSPDFKANLNKNQASYWRYKNYKASFLPIVGLSATLPSYSNSSRRLTNDLGQDIFVNQNQSRIEGRLSISQNIPYTGGSLSINSQLERIDIFGANSSTGYFVTPFSINYNQNSLFYNPFKWDKKIEPLIYEESKKDFIENMEKISLTTSRFYFSLLKSQMQLKIANNNLSNQDTLYQIAKGRFKIGKIAENDLLQMELSLLNSKNSVTTSKISLKRAAQNFTRYLGLGSQELELNIPVNLSPFNVDIEKALEEASSNRKSVIEFRRKRLEAEKELARVKGNNKLQLNVNANFGISQQGALINDLFQDFNRQQNISVTLSLPVFDWGVSKSRRKIAEANLDLVNTNLEQDKQAFEQEIYLHTLNWSNQRVFLKTSEKAKEIATKRYDITKKRYILGKITITDLNLAQSEKDRAVVVYLNSLEKFWVDYYTLRRLTLYDFLNDKKIEIKDIIYN
ncbi:outer membrane protein TolC [Lutibacter sp. Hel_I_33_5]|uniref:TolC family protein n=1 Tax=Lutibacter sp. Hel_I_33_5 TaxID=1566289 RepID=UPI0011A2B0FA|nr:TolC family protein [Lutibacter sp. Hel_I_33_5]TVZ55217.1 outer membrane protein TolC [Lutibacter sp. Hel_I_33_5]